MNTAIWPVRFGRSGLTDGAGSATRVWSFFASGEVACAGGAAVPAASGFLSAASALTGSEATSDFGASVASDFAASTLSSEAALGAKIEVPTLSEGRVVVTVPPETSSGMKLRLKGKGIVDPQTNSAGDQYVVIKIVVPKGLSESDKTLYRQLAKTEKPPRDNLW